MSILRPACYKLFAPIIDAVYDRFEKGSGEPKRIITTSPEMEAFLIEIITSTLREGKTGIERDTDLFGYGVDSLQATRVRNVISKTVELGGKNLGQNVVYEYPSVTKLAEYLLNVVAGGQGERTEEQEHQAMLDMVEKWAAKIELGQAQNVTTQGKTVAGEVVVSLKILSHACGLPWISGLDRSHWLFGCLPRRRVDIRPKNHQSHLSFSCPVPRRIAVTYPKIPQAPSSINCRICS